MLKYCVICLYLIKAAIINNTHKRYKIMTITNSEAQEKIRLSVENLNKTEDDDNLLESKISLLHSLRNQIPNDIKKKNNNLADNISFDGLLSGIINSKNIYHLELLSTFINFLGLKSFGIIGPALMSVPAHHMDDFLSAISGYLDIYYTEINNKDSENPFPMANANLQAALTEELNKFTEKHEINIYSSMQKDLNQAPPVTIYARFFNKANNAYICQTNELITHLPIEEQNTFPVQIEAVIQDDGIPVYQNIYPMLPVNPVIPYNLSDQLQPQTFFSHNGLLPQAFASSNSNASQKTLSYTDMQNQINTTGNRR